MNVAPTYEAFSRLKIEPNQPSLFESRRGGSDPWTYETYLQTQVNWMLSDQVLKKAVGYRSVRDFPLIKGSEDPKADLRRQLSVEIESGTYFIRVALQSRDPNEAAGIVNAVVKSYLEEYLRFERSRNSVLMSNLKDELKKLDAQILDKQAKLMMLQQEGDVGIRRPTLNLSPSKNEDDPIEPTFSNATEYQVVAMINEMTKIDFELITLKAQLKVRQELEKGLDATALEAPQDGDEFNRHIQEEFFNDPEVKGLLNEIDEVRKQLEHQKELVRRRDDPARRAWEKKKKELDDDWQELWDKKRGEIAQRLKTGVHAGGLSGTESASSLQQKIRALQEKKDGHARMYQNLKLQDKVDSSNALQFSYVSTEHSSLISSREKIKQNLIQVEFQAQREEYLVELIDPAEVPKVPSNNKRYKYMAMAPLGVLFAMLGLFLLLEIKAGRVVDPDVLSTCVRSEVYALPPLPTRRALRNQSQPSTHDQIEQFVQRLDHLRFAICGDRARVGTGRCVLITSAIGGEGKTTLAAQLAARCGNAGMSTLLIDGDLRRAALCPLLEVPEGPGLSDVLKGDATVEDVVVPVQGGTFNLFPAGTPIKDTSGILHDRRAGLLITQLRQLYDLIIIDAPPVLPVPDALIVGQWADGAILASRYDISRFPQVERARRQLDSAGIAVLGTVINGMRHSDTYYGRYTYRRRDSSQVDPSNTV
jgi:capsular exopolysaccharide synthesis family protein